MASVLSILMGLGVIFGVVIILWYFFGRKDPVKELQEYMRIEAHCLDYSPKIP